MSPNLTENSRGDFLRPTDGLKSIWGSEIVRPKIVFSDAVRPFREVFDALEAIGDHFGQFYFRRCSLIFVGFGRLSSVGGEKS